MTQVPPRTRQRVGPFRGLARLLALAAALRCAHANPAVAPVPTPPPTSPTRFEVRLAPALQARSASGRLFVVLAPASSREEPRLALGETGTTAPPFVARDVEGFSSGDSTELDRRHATFPLASLDHLPPGTYRVQALLSTNRDLRLPNAPGSFVSPATTVTLPSASPGPVRLELDHQLPPETLPEDTDAVRFVRLRSRLLSDFHRRPMFLRATVVLPRSFGSEPTRRYPLLVRIGGFGERHTAITHALAPGGALADARRLGPEFLVLQLDGAGPWGDPYQVNSANNGPYGDALVQELIPYVEQTCRGLAQPHARLLTGGSTGGWVSLALQVFYPDYFGGCWSGYPDSPDFHAFQLVDLYSDANAYVNPAGFERPSKRSPAGDIAFTMRHELQLENALGIGDRYATSGGQWGSWAAVYGPAREDGTPAAPWDPRTGAIDPAVVARWRDYDLSGLVDRYWTNLAPRLAGKIHAWVGTRDEYFLDGGLRRFADTLARHQPPLDARIRFEPDVGHGWDPLPWTGLLQEMDAHVTRTAPKSAEAAREALMRAKYGHGAACPHCRGGR